MQGEFQANRLLALDRKALAAFKIRATGCFGVRSLCFWCRSWMYGIVKSVARWRGVSSTFAGVRDSLLQRGRCPHHLASSAMD